MEQRTVLIISDDAEFSRAVTGHWRRNQGEPTFTLMSGDLCQDLRGEDFDLAILGSVRPALFPAALAALIATSCPIIFVCNDERQAQTMRAAYPRVMTMTQSEGWLEVLALLMGETLKRCEVSERASQLEQANALLERQAALGRYMLEMRHTINNALTSVLGNAELLLIDQEPRTLTARAQMETIRNMAVRIHEILQRFSSIDKEMSVLERVPEKPKLSKSHGAAASS